jgi:uncharacterized protein with GYD domain
VEDGMLFITLAKFKGKPTKESLAQAEKLFKQMTKEGAKIIGVYWTLGRYDAVTIIEGPDEKTAIRSLVRWGDMLSTETLIAVTREEAAKLVQ